jgi:glycosyltransferase involved in cell wall biosynthesis
MSGGDRIAIEFLKRWTHAFQEIVIVTTLAGRSMYVRNSLLEASYVVSTKLVLSSHSLPNNIMLQALATMKSILLIPRLLRRTIRDNMLVYSTSEFPGDFLPALILRLLRPRSIWLASFFLFAPSPFSPENPYMGTRSFRAALWHMAQIPIFSLTRLFADLVFVTNEHDRHRFTNERLSAGRVIAIRGGVDLSLSQDVPESVVKSYDAVFVGRLHPQKGVLQLVEVWKLVCEKLPDAHLAIIGNGELELELSRRIAAYGLSTNIKLLGFVDGRDKIEIFKKSRIVLHPVIYDSGGMAPAEAFACGLPGICFDLNVLRSYYPQGMLRVPPYDIQKFADSVLQLLQSKDLYDRLSREGVELVSSWDWNTRASELLEAVKVLT